MISAEFINNFLLYLKKPSNCLKVFLVVCLFSYFLITRTYNIESRFGFDHDQEKAAEAAWNLVKNHKISLIGIETSKGGIFAGPLLNWTHAIFLQIWNFDPLALAYQAILTNLLLLALLFAFVRKISNSTQAIMAIFLYSLSPRMVSYDISGSPISYMNLHTMLVVYIYYKIVYEKQTHLLSLLGLVLGLGYHIHVFLLFSIVPVLLLLTWHKSLKNKYNFIKLITFFSLPMLSAVAFDVKHNFLMTKNTLFLIHNNSNSELLKIIEIPKILLSLLSDTVIQTTRVKPLLFVPLILLTKYLFQRRNSGIYNDLLLFIFVPCLLLFFYNGPISEYYLIASVVPFVIFASLPLISFFKFNKYVFFIILASVALINTNTIIVQSKNPHSLKVKKLIFEYIIKTNNSKQVNIMYNLPQEYNYGFTYLAKWYKIENNDAGYKFLIEHEIKPDVYNENQESSSKERFGYFKLTSIM